jgi:predicted dehydrogenase
VSGRAARIEPVRVGVIGCGLASELYLTTISRVALIDVIACADISLDRAQQISRRFDIERVLTVEELLEDASVELVANLTPPRQHSALTLAALNAGKSVYTEKPLALSTQDALRLRATALRLGLVLGCAPDTVLCAAAQSSRRAIERGLLGRPFAACSFDLSSGHEKWHTNAAFYYEQGGGPLLDLGPYSLTWLVNLIGPVVKVYGVGTVAHHKRRLPDRGGSRAEIAVDVWTHVSALLEFQAGLTFTLGLSYDVCATAHSAFEVYGSGGTLSLPDPCHGQGAARFYSWDNAEPADVAASAGFVGSAGQGMGLVDVACAMRFSSPVRVSADVALHVLDVLDSVLRSAEKGHPVAVTSSCTAPPLVPAIAVSELAGPEFSWVERYLEVH